MRFALALALAAVGVSACRADVPPPTPVTASPRFHASISSTPVPLTPKLEASFARWEEEGPTGDAVHRDRLQRLVSVIRQRLDDTREANVVFVCTHNSRRSHMAQLLGLAAARRKGLDRVQTFSGGTEVTAFNPRAVAALGRVGYELTPADESKNPRYAVRFSPNAEPAVAYSKRFTDPPNPTSGFVVVMTCSQADAACPVVDGAVARVAVPYEDPKVADGTPDESARYDERVAQIGRDMAWVFAAVARP